MKGFRVWGLATRKIAYSLFALLFYLYPIPYTLYPVSAEVKIGDYFGFSGPDYTSLGQATSQLVTPIFSIATFVVILYFLLGAFKYLKAGGNKEDVESAKQMILHAIIGFMVLMFAFLILQFILSSLFKVTDFKIIE